MLCIHKIKYQDSPIQIIIPIFLINFWREVERVRVVQLPEINLRPPAMWLVVVLGWQTILMLQTHPFPLCWIFWLDHKFHHLLISPYNRRSAEVLDFANISQSPPWQCVHQQICKLFFWRDIERKE